MTTFILAACMQIAPTNSLAAAVERLAGRHNLDPRLVLAIVGQESSGSMITTSRAGKLLDIGIMQINERTASAGGFNLSRLLFDTNYNLEAGIKILAQKVRQCERKLAPWSCYHSTQERRRLLYMLAVARHFEA